MCIACELGFWSAMDYVASDAQPPQDKDAQAFTCDAPEAEPKPQPKAEESKP